MATTFPTMPAEFRTLTVHDAANAESGRIPITRKLVMDAMEEVMLQEDRPSFRPGGALEEAGDNSSGAREKPANEGVAATE